MEIDFTTTLVDPPFVLTPPRGRPSPLIVTSPHSGRVYPTEFLSASRLSPDELRQSEDCFVDQLVSDAPDWGAHLLAAQFPRAYCDANREPYELDPAMFDGPVPSHANTRSPRVAGGLGTIARVVGNGKDIYAKKLPYAEAARRIRRYYHPYHDALSTLLAETLDCFGQCILLDCHSMPPLRRSAADPGGPAPDIVLGDRFGTACTPYLTDCVADFLSGRDYRVARNTPYAGGFTTSHYGRPGQGIHTLQIELDRTLYMQPGTLQAGDGFERLQNDLSALVGHVSAFAQDLILKDAAE